MNLGVTGVFGWHAMHVRLWTNTTYLHHGGQGHPKGTIWLEVPGEGQGSTLLTDRI